MLLNWNIYQINSETQNLIGVKFRGSLRKFSVENNIILLTENAVDEENVVRFALIVNEKEKDYFDKINIFLTNFLENPKIKIVLENIPNPILSKLKNNDLRRY